MMALNINDTALPASPFRRPVATAAASDKSASPYRRIIKFKTHDRPVSPSSANDVSFMPKRDFGSKWLGESNYKYEIITSREENSTSEPEDFYSRNSYEIAKSNDHNGQAGAERVDEGRVSATTLPDILIETTSYPDTTTTFTPSTTVPTMTTTTIQSAARLPSHNDDDSLSTSIHAPAPSPHRTMSSSTTTSTQSPHRSVAPVRRRPTSLWNDRNRQKLTVKRPPAPSKEQRHLPGRPEVSTAAVSKAKNKSNWGAWNKWSECSRSCGGGVRIQSRPCLR